jgi:DNA uptake protein ComE-like DNA-binding protein
LRHDPKRAENESVQARRQFAAIAVLAVCFAGAANAAFARAQSAASRAAPKTKSIPPLEARIDINHASADELLKVPGMTPSWAGRIVRFRPYRTERDLLDRGVLPSDVYDRIKAHVIAHRDKE